MSQCSFSKDEEVGLPNGEVLSRAASKKDFHLVRSFTNAIWWTDAGAHRSFTGTNRFVGEGGQKPAQQSLSPHKVEADRVSSRHYSAAQSLSEEEAKQAAQNHQAFCCPRRHPC
ncbi:uncharacterized protein LOC125758250 [Rhipicephalus sanguineus]|uniref:uncharacterized protein LOC125758250 n=1 Tax=Rhipicephalus sanguineus TaxID=34632 RepID=UPI0020C56CA2|nr:uncharacterized protein LOC125758250 [Rhipicephalus sanguineus]